MQLLVIQFVIKMSEGPTGKHLQLQKHQANVTKNTRLTLLKHEANVTKNTRLTLLKHQANVTKTPGSRY
jgi:hypothetical protein